MFRMVWSPSSFSRDSFVGEMSAFLGARFSGSSGFALAAIPFEEESCEATCASTGVRLAYAEITREITLTVQKRIGHRDALLVLPKWFTPSYWARTLPIAETDASRKGMGIYRLAK
jgi:hypothetical protein